MFLYAVFCYGRMDGVSPHVHARMYCRTQTQVAPCTLESNERLSILAAPTILFPLRAHAADKRLSTTFRSLHDQSHDCLVFRKWLRNAKLLLLHWSSIQDSGKSSFSTSKGILLPALLVTRKGGGRRRLFKLQASKSDSVSHRDFPP